jgi:hypothetical protein
VDAERGMIQVGTAILRILLATGFAWLGMAL